MTASTTGDSCYFPLCSHKGKYLTITRLSTHSLKGGGQESDRGDSIFSFLGPHTQATRTHIICRKPLEREICIIWDL